MLELIQLRHDFAKARRLTARYASRLIAFVAALGICGALMARSADAYAFQPSARVCDGVGDGLDVFADAPMVLSLLDDDGREAGNVRCSTSPPGPRDVNDARLGVALSLDSGALRAARAAPRPVDGREFSASRCSALHRCAGPRGSTEPH